MPDDGGWVGSARISRRANALPPGGRLTDVAWLYSWPDRTPASAEATTAALITDYIRANAAVVLPEASGWRGVTVIPYDPAVNGSLEWWRSGEASRTVTRDAFDLNQQTGSNQTRDNPTGPTTVHAPDFNPAGTNDPNSAFNKLLGLATTVAWVAGGIAVLVYVVGPLVGAVLAPKTPARTNPSDSDRLQRLASKFLHDNGLWDKSVRFDSAMPDDIEGHLWIKGLDSQRQGWIISTEGRKAARNAGLLLINNPRGVAVLDVDDPRVNPFRPLRLYPG